MFDISRLKVDGIDRTYGTYGSYASFLVTPVCVAELLSRKQIIIDKLREEG
jgi:hypothetical protein